MRRGSAGPLTAFVAAFVAAGVVAMVLAVAAAPSTRPAGGIAVWSDSVVDADEVEQYASLAEMTRSADAVVRGRVVAVAPGRVFGDAAGDPLHYAAATVRVEELLAGTLPGPDGRQLTLEIPLFDGPGELDRLGAALPGAESIFFLRNKGESARLARQDAATVRVESAYHRLVVFLAVVVNEGGRAAVIPGDGDFLDALDGAPFADVVREVREAR